MSEVNVELAPFAARGQSLAGFVVCGRWPESTQEWCEALRLVVRLAAVPGMVPMPTVFHTTEEKPQVGGEMERPVGVLRLDGPVVGDEAPKPGSIGEPLPHAALLLHPPGDGSRSVSEDSASGCLLLPGLPELGLAHRAAWVDAQADGTVTRWVSQDDVDPNGDPDTAVLAMLLAA